MYHARVRRVLCFVASLAVAAACGGSKSTPVGPAPALPNAPPAVSAYLTEVLSIMQVNSINRLQVDWTSLRAQVTARAQGAQTIADLYPAIAVALGVINDHHSFFLTPSGTGVGNPSGRACSAPTAPDATVPSDIGYVRVAEWGDPNPVTTIAFADGIQRQIRNADRADLSGWIVDVRGNRGGNMWPMVAGVGPVVGEGLLGFFIAPGNGLEQSWSFEANRAKLDGSSLGQTSTAYTLLKPNARVAVLTDSLVASSGEAVVVAFRGRPNTRSFGTPTCGLSTANATFTLSDGARLVLCVSTMADRNHVRYGDVIAPDETIAGSDAVVARAIAWLRSQ